MKTENGRFLRRSFPRLLVLVPHRDVRRSLRAWSGLLFASGLEGAWSFPWVVPLAALGRRPSDAQLKALARALRERRPAEADGFAAGPPALARVPLSPGGRPVFAFGPSLDISLPDFPGETGDRISLRRISPVVLGAALLHGPAPDGLPAPPPVSFRASALAVMRFYPPDSQTADDPGDFSFEWEIGKLCWLPKGFR